jgi:predicted DNA-binding protein
MDIETIVSLKETTISSVLREAIYEYLERSHKQNDDPVFPNDIVKERPRGGYCEDYIRFQLPAEMKNEFQELAKKRGLIVSVLLRLMIEHYVKANSLQDILGEFQKEVQENAIVG